MNYFRFLRGLVNEPAQIYPEIYRETRVKKLLATYAFLCLLSFIATIVYLLGVTKSTMLLGLEGTSIFLFVVLILIGSVFSWMAALFTTYKVLRWRKYNTSVKKVLKAYLIPQIYLLAIPSIIINVFIFVLGMIAFVAPNTKTILAIMATCPGTVLFVGGIWSLVLFVIGIKSVHRSTMKAAIISGAGAAVFFTVLYLFATGILALLVGLVG